MKVCVTEKFDGPLAMIVVRGVDNRFAGKVNQAWNTPLIPVIDSALEGDIEEIRRLVTDQISQKIAIPGIYEEVELMMFDGFTRFTSAAVAWFLERKRAV